MFPTLLRMQTLYLDPRRRERSVLYQLPPVWKQACIYGQLVTPDSCEHPLVSY